jgi:hypothetical protein
MARCQTCGMEVDDPSQRFCGGDRCANVFMKHSAPRLGGTATSPPEGPELAGRGRFPPVGSIGYTGSYREHPVDIVEVSVVSVLEARGPE